VLDGDAAAARRLDEVTTEVRTSTRTKTETGRKVERTGLDEDKSDASLSVSRRHASI